jgi:hypothetical protein
MISRGTGFKLAILATPLAAGILSLHAFGEPAGRSVRAAAAAISYPAREHGTFVIRARRGSDYPAFAAQTLEGFTRSLVAWGAPLGVVPPPRVTVLLLDSPDDLERFGLDPAGLEGGGMADPAAGVIALVSEGRTHHPDHDARALRHCMTRLALAPVLQRTAATPWVAEGLASYFEVTPPGSGGSGLRAPGDGVPSLAPVLEAAAQDFRGVAGVPLSEAARLWVAFLVEKMPAEFFSWLRAPVAERFEECFGERGGVEARWREWARRPK